MGATIYSYARNRGLFAGVSLEGASLAIDKDANGAFYSQEGIRPEQIIARGYSGLPKPAKSLLDTLNKKH